MEWSKINRTTSIFSKSDFPDINAKRLQMDKTQDFQNSATKLKISKTKVNIVLGLRTEAEYSLGISGNLEKLAKTELKQFQYQLSDGHAGEVIATYTTTNYNIQATARLIGSL